MKRISTSFISIAILLVGSFSVRAYAGHSGTFTLNEVETQASGQTMSMQTEEGRSLNVVKTPLLSQEDFSTAKVLQRKEKTVLQATLTDTGTTKLHTYSSTHVGQKLAVLIGNQVLAAPVIRVPIGQKLEVDALSKTQAEELAQIINH